MLETHIKIAANHRNDDLRLFICFIPAVPLGVQSISLAFYIQDEAESKKLIENSVSFGREISIECVLKNIAPKNVQNSRHTISGTPGYCIFNDLPYQ